MNCLFVWLFVCFQWLCFYFWFGFAMLFVGPFYAIFVGAIVFFYFSLVLLCCLLLGEGEDMQEAKMPNGKMIFSSLHMSSGAPGAVGTVASLV